MFEKSVITAQEITNRLEDLYGISGARSVKPLTGGTALCRLITCPDGRFVLKEFQARYSATEVEIEPALTQFLRTHGIPAPRFVKTLQGPYVWEHRGRAFHLQEFVEGTIFRQNEAPDWLLRDSAILLGRIHQVLVDFSAMREGFHRGWFRWEAGARREQYAELIGRAELLPAGPVRQRILDDLKYREGQVDAIALLQIDPEKLTWRNSHGDYHLLQLICDGGQIRAVIDFSGACRLPAVWEVIRSYSLGDPACAEGRIDAARLKSYVTEYLGAGGQLNGYDLAVMPQLYRLQLVRSRYGYEEYLSKGAEGYITGREGGYENLLQFGFWRTDMCRWLADRAADLAGELAGLAGGDA